jgi:hypothetical protein
MPSVVSLDTATPNSLRKSNMMHRTESMRLPWTSAARSICGPPGQGKLPLTFGDLIHEAYEVCGKRKATAFVRLAVNARLVEFIGAHRFVIAET